MARISVEAQRREQILGAAIDVVARKGYEATTLRDVADAAGTSTGTVNYYFANKDDVLASALVEVAERFRRRVDEALDGVEDPRERLLAVADACNPDTPDAVANQVVWTEFWVRAARNEQLRDLHAGLYDDWRRRIASIVRAGVARGAFRQVDAYEWACQFAALLDGLALHVILHPGALGAAGMASSCRAFVAGTLDADVAQPASETGSPVSAER
jgi:AcrR family transcriptional regulator